MIRKIMLLSASAFMVCSAFPVSGQTHLGDSLQNNFVSPPQSSRARVWWHWMNGNISEQGIRKDLLWMQRSGIGGFQNFDAALVTPQIVDHRLVYMSPEWKKAMKLTARLADSLNLEMAIAGSPGWSESGGPWVQPEDGMKKYVWSETTVQEGRPFTGNLPKPPVTTGIFQNIPVQQDIVGGGKAAALPTFYQDIAVIAYRLPDTYVSFRELAPAITSTGGHFSLDQLTDGDLATSGLLPSVPKEGSAWIQFSFSAPQTIKALTIVGGGDKGPHGLYGPKEEDRSFQASDDGVNFRQVCFIPAGDVQQQTLSIPVTKAKYFRITFKNPVAPPDFGSVLGGSNIKAEVPKGTEIAEIVLHPHAVIDRFEEKAGFSAYSEKHPWTRTDANEAIPLTDIIDITDKMDSDGKLDWTPSKGRWKVVRFGYSLTGQHNGPAIPEATGLEVDKLDPRAVRSYFENYLDQYKDASAGLIGEKGIRYMVTDSWEAGPENWTRDMMQEFEKRRGYSMLSWMPVLTGKIVNSAQQSEQFLWDFRKTLSELVAENHYDLLTTILAERGMKRYSESHESGRALVADGMEVKRTAAVPMGAIWMPGMMNGNDLTRYQADLRESASVAHIYGQNLVAAESFSTLGIGDAPWSYSPETLKPVADFAMANGLNRFVIHTSVHQPVDDKIPGLGLGPFGQWFNRNETWAEQARPWTDYLARSSYMLQQGKFVADIAYLYGEDNNITNLFGGTLPDIPEGYSYDFINTDALVNLLTFKDGSLKTPSGMSYQVLMLDGSTKKLSLPALRKIAQLVKDGAVIGGPRPEMTPSLADDRQEFDKLVSEIWNSGNKRVMEGKTSSEVLASLKIQPDFRYSPLPKDAQLLYVHRKTADADIYWVNSRSSEALQVALDFRIEGKTPEIWHAETGRSEQASYSISNGRTVVSMELAPNDAVFIVFRSHPQQQSLKLPLKTESLLSTVEGPWKVSFQQDRGAPASATFDSLASFTENPDKGIAYFSGTATYTRDINFNRKQRIKGAQVWMDLGEVKNLAEVIVNGKNLGIVWKKPFRVNVTDALKPGKNKIEIRVTNLWVNRLIGDAQPDVEHKITYTTMPFYQAGSKLVPSGLLGPVKLISVK